MYQYTCDDDRPATRSTAAAVDSAPPRPPGRRRAARTCSTPRSIATCTAQRIDVQALAAELGLGRTTIYRWFGSREGLVGEVVVRAAEPLFDDARADAAVGHGGARCSTRSIGSTASLADRPGAASFLEHERDALRILTSSGGVVQPRMVAKIPGYIEEEVRAAAYRPPVDPATLALRDRPPRRGVPLQRHRPPRCAATSTGSARSRRHCWGCRRVSRGRCRLRVPRPRSSSAIRGERSASSTRPGRRCRSQMRRSVRSRPTISASSSGGLEPPDAQDVEVRLDHRLALELVLAEDREREEEAVGVRVHVAGRPDEVRDVAPPGAVAVDVDGVAEHARLASRARAPRTSPARARPPRGATCGRRPRSGSSRSAGKTVAIESSIRPASRLSRRRGSSSIARRRLKVSASPNTDAVSAVVSGVEALKSPSGCAR